MLIGFFDGIYFSPFTLATRTSYPSGLTSHAFPSRPARSANLIKQTGQSKRSDSLFGPRGNTAFHRSFGVNQTTLGPPQPWQVSSGCGGSFDGIFICPFGYNLQTALTSHSLMVCCRGHVAGHPTVLNVAKRAPAAAQVSFPHRFLLPLGP